ncbi:hypothetical protein GUITHDRAFT_139626 [Guillardia theta CCMP2712]|uniref:Uncharacterized protein n=1 Tax=Guillardia theta (strain CCMP2712) TaxID=905079 RepID=L1J8P1_GUITC|nr:hypothetical protein GUITHDRAFT_139626 [Guillardia theta CCMP2712]EKX44702.1 hypothetical protein GUITHDRAFT_139626 [Guillardia theta CCMP2712]|eukprot:XP_005831682.1 hypothetical protein GUITHDRAFT_139626 [Guillardia theta CCMP2712]
MEHKLHSMEPSWARDAGYSDRRFSNTNFPIATKLRSEFLMDKERAFDTPDVRCKGRQGPPSPAESMKEALNAIKRYDVISDMGKMQDSLLRIIEEQVRLRMQQQVERNTRANRENVMDYASTDGSLIREYQIQKEELFSEISRLQTEIMSLKEKNLRLKAENEQAYNLVKMARASETTLQHVLEERQVSLDLLKNAKNEAEKQLKEQMETARYELQRVRLEFETELMSLRAKNLELQEQNKKNDVKLAEASEKVKSGRRSKVAVQEIEQAKNAVSEAVLQAKKYKSLLEQETTDKERLQEENSTLSENLESYQKMLSHEQIKREETSAEILELRAALRTAAEKTREELRNRHETEISSLRTSHRSARIEAEQLRSRLNATSSALQAHLNGLSNPMKSIEHVLELNGKFCDASNASRDYDSQRGSPTDRSAVPPHRSPGVGSPVMEGPDEKQEKEEHPGY